MGATHRISAFLNTGPELSSQPRKMLAQPQPSPQHQQRTRHNKTVAQMTATGWSAPG